LGQCFYSKTYEQAPFQKFSYLSGLAFSVAFTDQGLCSLSQTVENCKCHDRKVCHNSIGCYTHISRDSQDQKVKYNGDHTGRKFPDKCGNSQLTAGNQVSE